MVPGVLLAVTEHQLVMIKVYLVVADFQLIVTIHLFKILVK